MDWEWGLEGLSFECAENGLKLIGVIFSVDILKKQNNASYCTFKMGESCGM